ncbi:sulfite exporter TauE/SafE family protein [Pseudogemmobacter bohemicus]|uniref:sulfite exporter TauE/SafE family protein n=1 Tax=Pseudogemmobacter bohemicus TaxID=2250708 RepID=UPI001E3368ED
MVYAAVGQAGASGYVAIMGVAGFEPLAMKTTALSLNLLVAAIGTALFLRNGRLSWRNVWPFAILGFPFAMLGGAIHLPETLYFPVVGAVLILSALQMARSAVIARPPGTESPVTPPFMAALVTGAVIGFVSGTTGTGGGVFLAPVILGMNWATARQTAATTAVYNLLNSAAALIGAYAAWDQMPSSMPDWLCAVAIGGLVGAWVGSRFLSDRWLRGILSVLLFASGVKLIW